MTEEAQETLEPQDVATPEHVLLRPLGFGYETEVVGADAEGVEVVHHHLNFLLSPFKIVTVVLDEKMLESVKRNVNGGVIIESKRILTP